MHVCILTDGTVSREELIEWTAVSELRDYLQSFKKASIPKSALLCGRCTLYWYKTHDFHAMSGKDLYYDIVNEGADTAIVNLPYKMYKVQMYCV